MASHLSWIYTTGLDAKFSFVAYIHFFDCLLRSTTQTLRDPYQLLRLLKLCLHLKQSACMDAITTNPERKQVGAKQPK